MKRLFLMAIPLACCLNLFSQEVWWVFFTDKANSNFDPYSYFDAKAIERRLQNHVSLYDSSDFPLNTQYCERVAQRAEEVVGASRWLNAVAVVANEEAATAIRQFPFVKKMVPIRSDVMLCAQPGESAEESMESGMAEAE